VAAAADSKIKEINRVPAAGHPGRARCSTAPMLVEATIRTVAGNTGGRRARWSFSLLFLACWANFRAALITALVMSGDHADHRDGHAAGKDLSSNLMSLGALDFGLIVDGAVIHRRETACATLAERRRELGSSTVARRAPRPHVTCLRQGDGPATVYGQDNHHPGLRAAAHLHRRRRQDLHADGDTPVIIALVTAFVLSLTFVPAMIAIAVDRARAGTGNRLVRGLKVLYLAGNWRRPSVSTIARDRGSRVAVSPARRSCSRGFWPGSSRRVYARLKRNIVMEVRRIPSTFAGASPGHAARHREHDQPPAAGGLRVLARSGTPDLAADPMAAERRRHPTSSVKPRDEWPDPDISKNDFDPSDRCPARRSLLGNKADFLPPPIQMRFNELIAGVREDLAIKIFW